MKKVFLAISCAALLSMGAISCSKDDNFDKGKKDGKAYCECMNNAAAIEDADAREAAEEVCDAIPNESKANNLDYMKGWLEAVMGCFEIED